MKKTFTKEEIEKAIEETFKDMDFPWVEHHENGLHIIRTPGGKGKRGMFLTCNDAGYELLTSAIKKEIENATKNTLEEGKQTLEERGEVFFPEEDPSTD